MITAQFRLNIPYARISFLLVACLVLCGLVCWGDTMDAKAILEKYPGLMGLIPEDSRVEKVAGGMKFLEGPVWHKNGFLLFSDCHQSGIYKWDPATGRVSLYREVSGGSNGLTFDNEGRLIAVEYGMHRLTREEKDGRVVELVSTYLGKRLNTTNDVVVKSDGSIYFTDPPYGVKNEDRELDFQGVYRLSPDGELILLVKDFDCPNGLAFSPDEKTLYIADSSSRMHIRAFDVKEDGTLSNGRVFAVLKAKEPGCPDGLKVDANGNVWSTGPGGIWVFDKTGKRLGIIETPEVPANCAWGDGDGKTLYITARTSLYRVRTNAKGIMPWIKN